VTGRTRLELGEWVELDGERHQVAGFTDRGIRLRSETGRTQLILIGALLSDPTFRATAAPAGAGHH
jgi:putative transposase